MGSDLLQSFKTLLLSQLLAQTFVSNFSNLDTQLGPLTDLKGRVVGADAVQSAVNEVIINAVEVKCHNQ